MPVYEYRCDKCRETFEVEQRIRDLPVALCPKCAIPSKERLISQTTFALKGGKWFKTGGY